MRYINHVLLTYLLTTNHHKLLFGCVSSMKTTRPELEPEYSQGRGPAVSISSRGKHNAQIHSDLWGRPSSPKCYIYSCWVLQLHQRIDVRRSEDLCQKLPQLLTWCIKTDRQAHLSSQTDSHLPAPPYHEVLYNSIKQAYIAQHN